MKKLLSLLFVLAVAFATPGTAQTFKPVLKSSPYKEAIKAPKAGSRISADLIQEQPATASPNGQSTIVNTPLAKRLEASVNRLPLKADGSPLFYTFVMYSGPNYDWFGLAQMKDGVVSEVFFSSQFTSDYNPYSPGIGIPGHYKYVSVEYGMMGNFGGAKWVDVDLNAKTISYVSIPAYSNGMYSYAVPVVETYSVADDCAYGFYMDVDNNNYSSVSWGKRDVETGVVTPLASFPRGSGPSVITADGNGVIWGLDYNMTLYTIDKQTGAATVVGQIQGPSISPGNLTCDTKTGMLYTFSSNSMFKIDPSTLMAEGLWTAAVSVNAMGVYIPLPEAEDGAPAAIQNLEADFGTEGSLTGTLEFDVPATTYDGNTQLTGNVYVTIVTNGEEEKTVQLPAGKRAKINHTVSESGMYSFTVYAKNGVGDGPKKSVSLYIGEDSPKAVTNLTYTKEGKTAKLSWGAPVETEHGGYLATDKLHYIVARIVGTTTTVLTTDLTATEYTDDLSSMTELSKVVYTITPEVGTLAGETAATNAEVFGQALTPPQVLVTPSAADLDIMAQYEFDGYDKTWYYYNPSETRTAIYLGDYNAYVQKDNWLATAPLHLEAGRYYTLTYDCIEGFTTLWYNDFMEVRLGKDGGVENLQNGIVLKETYQLPDENGEVKICFTPAETGDYRIGFHINTPQNTDSGYILMKSASIGAPMNGDVPAAANIYSANGHDMGELKVDIVISMPSETNTGKALEGDLAMEDVKIYNSKGEVVKTLNEVLSGEVRVVTDIDAVQGNNTFKIVAFNKNGEGEPATIDVWAGEGIPMTPENFKFEDVDGEVHLSWDAVGDRSADGLYVDTDNISYEILLQTSNGWQVVATTKETTHNFTRSQIDLNSGSQGLLYFALRSAGKAGKSAATASNGLIVGEPYETPYKESAAQLYPTHVWMIGNYEEYSGHVWTTDSFAADDDGGSFMFEPNAALVRYGNTDYCTLYFGKISMKDLVNPVLRFQAYINPYTSGNIEVYIGKHGIYDEQQQDLIGSVNFYGEGYRGEGWHTFTFDLSDYKDEDHVLVSFKGLSSGPTLWIDNIRLGSYTDRNLAADRVLAPSHVLAGDAFDAAARISNEGQFRATNFNINIFDGDDLLGVLKGDTVQVDTYKDFPVQLQVTADTQNPMRLTAVVDLPGDEVEADNTSAVKNVYVRKPELIAPTLQGSADGNKATLSWNAVEINADEPETVTEDFEDFDDWEIRDFNDWTLYDQSGASTLALDSYLNAFLPQAAIVFNPSLIGYQYYLPAYDGDRYLMSMVKADEQASDDWIITPQLSGRAQKLTFMVSEMTNQQANQEQYEIYFSTTDTSIDSFERQGGLNMVNVVAPDWEEVEIDVPEGVKYVAIRHTTSDGSGLMIDHVTYERNPLPFNYSVIGYNIYRNGEQLNNAPVKETTYEVELTGESDVFTVKTVYSIGFSAASNEVVVTSTGIAIQSTGTDAAHRATIYDLQGRRQSSTMSQPKGLYIISRDGSVRKAVRK